MATLSPPSVDLTAYSEETRQAIYQHAVEQNFTGIIVDDEPWDLGYGPDQAELQVLYLYGRWLVTWLKLEEPVEAPERVRRELLLVQIDRDGEISYCDV